MAKESNLDTSVQESNVLEQQLIHMRDAFRHHQNEIRKKYKISANEMEIILYINDFGPQRMKAIGERFKIKFSTLTSLVDKIERLNLVKRVNSKEDRRSILVTITKKGKRMLDEYNSQVRILAERIAEISREENLPEFVETLAKASSDN
ncbi:MarR family transcriptional regulator [Pontibacter sp. G13]|uniref:MarR family winged helix-turn-helix transcriptional regulator n=1 Tax=Pontibacter sp. G13 TaxID=3074898 RepID=UPI0028896352|nr:MarR family transcriptional regulator [Pontibacter sp. G13]WNJ19587.1 MarR family transcriptional regulator [Pontibacter sp. G13]